MAEVGDQVVYVYQSGSGLVHLSARVIQIEGDDRCALAVHSLGRVNHASLCTQGGICHGRYISE